MTVNRDLQIISDDGRGSGAVAVHRGCRADDNGRDVRRFGNDLADVVYNAAAYADEKIAGRIVMQENRADGVLIRFYALFAHDVKRIGKTALFFFFGDRISRSIIRVFIRKDESLFAAVFFEHCGNV